MLFYILIFLSLITSNIFDLSSSKHPLKPIFVRVPPNILYVTPFVPAIVECISKGSAALHINCLNDQGTIAKTSTAAILDQSNDVFFPKTKRNGKKQLDKISKSVHGNVHSVNLTISEKTVEMWFVKQFWCQCEAASHQDPAGIQDFIVSQKSYIEIAYIEKLFKQEPHSASVYLGRYIKLTCIAPDGNPKPKIYWKKNGITLNISDNSKINVSEDGSLVIFSTTPSDSGTYECVAFNQAGIRVSKEAKLEVLESEESGDWLPWTPWNACPSHCSYGKYCVDKCHKYLRRRSRLCKTSGKDKIKCPGPSLQTESCANFCRVDGEWGQWSDWSLCQSDCARKKLRQCNDPAPQSGGRICFPKNQYILKENCSTELCPSFQSTISQNRYVFRDMIIYVVLSIALFLLISVAIAVICFQKKQFFYTKRSRKLNIDKEQFILLKPLSDKDVMSKDASHDSSCKSSSFVIKDNSLTKDSSTSTICTSHQTDNVPSVDLTLRNTFNGKQVSFLPTSCHYTETDLIMPNPLTKHPPNDYLNLLTPVFLSKSEEHESDSNYLPITNCGGKVVLGSTGVSVTIIPDSFNAKETLFLNICTKYSDENLCEFENYSQLSSLIYCSVLQNIQLKKPVIITFPHCISSNSLSNWELKIMKMSSTSKWKEVLIVDDMDQSNGRLYCDFDEEYCYLMTFELFAFCLIGNSIKDNANDIEGNISKIGDFPIVNVIEKRLCVLSFLEPSCNPYKLQLNCYIFIDTKDIRDYLISKITERGCRILEIPKILSLKESNENVYISVECTFSTWKVHPKDKYQEILFSDLWNITTEPFVTRTINIEQSESNVKPFSAIVTIYQNNHYKDKIDISICFNSTEITNPMLSSLTHILPFHLTCKYILPSKTFRLPRATIRELSTYLDPPKLQVSQWLMIAKQLGIKNNLNYFLGQSSPTTYLLMLWEAKNREETALVDLRSILKVVGLVDVAAVFK